ncbi:MAG TPA: hypothetical protein DDY89_07290 [Lysinibacillus sp.]|nr:hypothetical protein [Lysinibacillus sp.]
MSQPVFQLSKFQIVGNEDGKAVVDYEIKFKGETLPFNKPLEWGSKHDLELLQAINDFIRKENFKQEG